MMQPPPSLQTSLSSSYLASSTDSYPTPPRLLSRPSSRTNLCSVTSEYARAPASSHSSPALPRPGAFFPEHHQKQHGASGKRRPLHSRTASARDGRLKREDEEDNWLLRTASSVIAISSMEEDGLSWLGKRESSVSLHDQGDDPPLIPQHIKDGEEEAAEVDELANLFHTSPLHTPRLPSSSRPYSRMHSGRTSRTVSKPGSRAMSRGSLAIPERDHNEGEASDEKGTQNKRQGPDWVYPEEIHRIEEKLAAQGLEMKHGADEEEVIDETEMRKVILGRVGGWVDWAVGWMEGRDDEVVESEEEIESRTQKLHERKGKRVTEASYARELVVDAPRPPPGGAEAGAWGDAKWLLGVAKQVALR